MKMFEKIDRHANLMYRMSETVHADLGEALIQQRLAPERLRAAIMSCTHCANAGSCAEWLDAHEAGAEAPPSYCRNRDLLERLQA